MAAIKLTKEGGRYYRAEIFFWSFTAMMFLPLLLLLLLAMINPLWFRESFFLWIQGRVNAMSTWRSEKTYRIYLGMDPKVWHALKD